MTDAESRKKGVCMHCSTPASPSRRRDGTGDRAIYWCVRCYRPAHGGASFFTSLNIASLPEVADRPSPQGSLPL